jgi:hypothetical protein
MSKKLDDASKNLREQFARAARQKAEQQRQQPEQAAETHEQGGSRMIKNQAPGMHLTPKDPAWNAIKGQDFNKELAKEKADFDSYYKQLNDSLKARREAQKQQELQKDREKDVE